MSQSVQYFHLLYGLRVSTNRPLPSIPTISAEQADLKVAFVDGAFKSEEFALPYPYCQETDILVRTDESGRYLVRYMDDVQFIIDPRNRSISAWWPPNLCIEDAAIYLLGPILGFYYRLVGTVSLHAGVIEIEKNAVAFVGDAGRGKSTLVASFVQAGFAMVNEDMAPIKERSGEFWILPGYPLVRLWPSSVNHLFGSPDALPRLTPGWDKRSWPLSRSPRSFVSAPLPLRAIYLLGERQLGEAPRIVPVSHQDAFMDLVSNTYVNYLLSGTQRRVEFELLGRVSSRVPVRRLIPGATIEQLPQMRASVLDDLINVPTH